MKLNHLYYFLIGICAVLFYNINLSIPIISDDILYGYIFPAQTDLDTPWGVDINNPINNIHDVFVSQYNHYFHHGGRIPVHIFVQFFAGLWGKTSFSIVTVFFFIAFVWILGLNSFDENKEKIVFFIPFFLLYVFIVQPKCFYSTIACGINYLWASVVCLTYYYLYEKKKVKNLLQAGGYCLLAFLAGWSHEGIVIPMGIAIGLHYLINRKFITLYDKLSIVFFFLGAALLVLAPGNFSRGSGNSVSYHSIVAFILHLRLFWVYVFSLLFISIYRGSKYVRKIIADSNHLIYGTMLGAILFLGTGLSQLRLGYGVDLLSVVLLSRLVSSSLYPSVVKLIGVIASFATVIVFGLVFHYEELAKTQFDMVLNTIESTSETSIRVSIPANLTAPFYWESYVRDVAHDSTQYWILSVWETKYNKVDIAINE